MLHWYEPENAIFLLLYVCVKIIKYDAAKFHEQNEDIHQHTCKELVLEQDDWEYMPLQTCPMHWLKAIKQLDILALKPAKVRED